MTQTDPKSNFESVCVYQISQLVQNSDHMHTEKLTYVHDTVNCHGFIAYDETIDYKRPVVLVAPAWRGQDDFARERAKELSLMGFVGFAIDIYGEGKCVSDEEAPEAMKPFWLDRLLLQKRAAAALDYIRKHPKVDPNRIGAIGFCFGGLTVYELFRSGADVKGVVCFHGVFDNEMEGYKAKTTPVSPKTIGKLLILHGDKDPMVSDQDLQRVKQEMTEAGIDWQLHIFGSAMHAFTNPLANDPNKGTVYNKLSAKRAWHLMRDFFLASL